jgi:hypothetical protein
MDDWRYPEHPPEAPGQVRLACKPTSTATSCQIEPTSYDVASRGDAQLTVEGADQV